MDNLISEKFVNITTGQQIENLTKLLNINSLLTSTLDYDSLLIIIMEKIKEIMNTEASTLLLLDEEKNELVFKVALGSAGKKLEEKYRIKIGQGIAGWVAEKRLSLIINDVYEDERFDSDFDRLTGYKTRAIICSPLLFQGKLIGVIEAINPLYNNDFNNYHLMHFNAFSNQAAIALNNASIYNKLEKKFEERTADLKRLKDKLLITNERLQQAMNDSSILVSDIGHKFHNELWPFAQMILLIKEILLKFKNDDKNFDPEYIKFVYENLNKCEKSLERIELMKEKIKKNFGKQVEKSFNKINFIIDNILNNFSENLKHNNITLEKDYEFNLNKEIKINPEQIKIAIENIINNSIKAFESKIFNKDKKKILIKIINVNNHVNITIEDNGIGIPEEIKDNIFSMFFTMSTNFKKKGLGLGLHLTKWIIEDCHKGSIKVESKENHYTRFLISLPENGDLI